MNIYRRCLGRFMFLLHTSQVDTWQVKLLFSVEIVPGSMWHEVKLKAEHPRLLPLSLPSASPQPLTPRRARTQVPQSSSSLRACSEPQSGGASHWGGDGGEGRLPFSPSASTALSEADVTAAPSHREAFSFASCLRLCSGPRRGQRASWAARLGTKGRDTLRWRALEQIPLKFPFHAHFKFWLNKVTVKSKTKLLSRSLKRSKLRMETCFSRVYDKNHYCIRTWGR